MDDDAARPALWPVAAILVVAAVLIAAILLVFGADDSADEPRLAGITVDPTTATTTTPPTTAPPTTVSPATIATITPTPPPATAPAVADAAPVADAPPNSAEGALQALAQLVPASAVTPPVRKSAGTFAVASVARTARLYEWDGDQWHERQVIDTPAPVEGVDAVDVTGDGTSDFVIQMAGAASVGGVYNPRGVGWGWLPFTGPIGTTEVVEGLQPERGRLRSEMVDDAGGRQLVEWHWNGNAFTIR